MGPVLLITTKNSDVFIYKTNKGQIILSSNSYWLSHPPSTTVAAEPVRNNFS